jgi:AcrR family transcriptional regulator
MPDPPNSSKVRSKQDAASSLIPMSLSVVRRRHTLAKKPSREDAFAAARKLLLRGVKLDMASLANQLGIGRATLYRWTGDRERLINAVFLTFLIDTFAWIENRVSEEQVGGAELIARWVEYTMNILTRSRPVQALLRNEPDVALRVLTDDGPGSLQGTTINKLVSIIEEEIGKGNYQPRLEPRLLAYAIVRLVDSFVYGDIIAGVEVNHAAASKVIRSLL